MDALSYSDHRAYGQVYELLLTEFGPQDWWPAETPFEMMVGAILTQNTAWNQVEQSIFNLQSSGRFSAPGLLEMPDEELASHVRPSGFLWVKSHRLKALLKFWMETYGGKVSSTRDRSTPILREELLSVRGVGPETADCILVYALGRPSFVVDKYTRRLFARLGLIEGKVSYSEIQERFTSALTEDVLIYNEYHALIVALGKRNCRSTPLCQSCPLSFLCPVGIHLIQSE